MTSDAKSNALIPSPFEPLQNIIAKFTSKGLNLKDVVALSGPFSHFSILITVYSLALEEEPNGILSFPLVLFITGAHSIGYAQCFTFQTRLFNFQGTGQPDPALNTTLLSILRRACPNKADSNTNIAPLDSVTTNRFDNTYYENLAGSTGLLESDQALMANPDTAALVNRYRMYPQSFFLDFSTSMLKLGYVGVLTGEKGEIRKNCRFVN